jgi:hypothetical protein
MLVVLFLMVLFTGVVAVAMAPALRQERLNSGARMVMAALRCARDYAVAHQTNAEVRLGEDGGVAVYVQTVDETGTEDGAAVGAEDSTEDWRALTTPAGRRRTLPDGVRIIEVTDPEAAAAPHASAVSFTALGQGERLRITLRDTRERTAVIEVDGLTGRCGLAKDEKPE